MIAGPHCYSFFDGNDAFAARGDSEMTAFFLTDFLVRQFDAFVWRPMGLDRHPELRDMIFGNYERLIYLAQTEDTAPRRRGGALCRAARARLRAPLHRLRRSRDGARRRRSAVAASVSRRDAILDEAANRRLERNTAAPEFGAILVSHPSAGNAGIHPGQRLGDGRGQAGAEQHGHVLLDG